MLKLNFKEKNLSIYFKNGQNSMKLLTLTTIHLENLEKCDIE